MFCISHLFCHTVSWLRHEVVLSPWWEVCCREEPVHSWHLLKQNQVIYIPSNTCLSCHQYLYTSGICWDKNRSFTHPITPTYEAISICTLLAFAETKTGCLHNQSHLFTMLYAFIHPGICWNRKTSFTHLIASTYSEISMCTLLAFAEIKRGLLHTKPHLLTMTLVFVNSWHLLKQNRSLTHQVMPI